MTVATNKLKQIGKGGFSRCYELTPDTVLLESYDPVKAVMADGKFPKTKLFPKVERYAKKSKTGSSFYTMKYFTGRPLRSTKKWLENNLKPFHYETYKDLYQLRIEVDLYIKGHKKENRQVIWNTAFESLSNKRLGELLVEANNECCKVAEKIMFDFEPKNVACDNGNLILLDCFCSATEFWKLNFPVKPKWTLDWI